MVIQVAKATLPVLDDESQLTVKCLVCDSEVLRDRALVFDYSEVSVCTTCAVEMVRVRVGEILAHELQAEVDDELADDYAI
ncbi:MAG: hypothetical protein ACRC46_13325 [Thermoguttaceae bacterium]